MRSERDVKRKVVLAIKSAGGWYCMPHGAGYGRAGVPDIVACIKGMVIAVECKWNGNKPTPAQSGELQAIAGAGGKAYVVDELNVESWCKNLLLEHTA